MPASETIKLLASYLQHQVSMNDASSEPIHLTRFHARNVPSIDLYNYLVRILKYAYCNSDCFLALLIYFERIRAHSEPGWVTNSIPGQEAHIQRHGLTLNSFNIHRLIIAGTLVAVKFLSDVFYTNAHIART